MVLVAAASNPSLLNSRDLPEVTRLLLIAETISELKGFASAKEVIVLNLLSAVYVIPGNWLSAFALRSTTVSLVIVAPWQRCTVKAAHTSKGRVCLSQHPIKHRLLIGMKGTTFSCPGTQFSSSGTRSPNILTNTSLGRDGGPSPLW